MVINTVDSGGAPKNFSLLANLLSNEFEITVLHYYSRNIVHFFNNKIKLIQLTNDFWAQKNKIQKVFRRLELIKSLYKYIKSNQVDLIISFVSDVNVDVFFATKLLRVKLILAERGNPYHIPILRRKITEFVYSNSDYVVFQFAFDGIERFSRNILRYDIIGNLIDDSKIITKYNPTSKIIISVGELTPNKGHSDLIKAVKMIESELGEFKFHIYGDGPEKSNLENLIQLNELQSVIILKGYHRNILKRLEEAYFLIHLATSEGIPNVLLEAFSSSLPVVAYDSKGGGVDYLLGNSKYGIKVPLNDLDFLAKSILLMITNPDLAKSYSSKSRFRNSNLNANQNGLIWIELVKEVLSTKLH